MKKIVFLTAAFLTFSCAKDSSNELNESQDLVSVKMEMLENYVIPEEDIGYLQSLGFSGSTAYAIEKTDLVNNEVYISYILEGDIEIRKDFLPSMAQKLNSEGFTNHYRTTNLVNAPRTIRVIATNMNNNTLRQGLTAAIANYNALPIDLTFTLEFRTVSTIFEIAQAIQDSDILVRVWGGPGGGQAGFPTGGNPFPEIFIQGGTALLGVDACEHVATHEIGHTIGLRHTDFYNRSLSCAGFATFQGNEGAGTVGAIHIPGTPQMNNGDPNSIMRSCGAGNGEFTNFDVTALTFLY